MVENLDFSVPSLREVPPREVLMADKVSYIEFKKLSGASGKNGYVWMYFAPMSEPQDGSVKVVCR